MSLNFRPWRAASLAAVWALLAALAACSYLGYGSDPGPEPTELPSDPLERAAVLGLKNSYRDSAMWQIQRPAVINVTPAAPTGALLLEQDPKELYCVCVEYEARYKTDWSTAEGGPWERTVRNLLVMKAQSGAYMALKPLNVCPVYCE